ncbi:MAG: hypothetical protein O3C10_09630 [Chloroflexi bacterium]|nr:hypothetical protein [Chloroflexota bacterium]
MTEDVRDLIRTGRIGDTGLTGTAAALSAIPVLGGPLSNIMSGTATSRRFGRVDDTMGEFAQQLERLKVRVNEEYLKSEDFEEILEQTLRRASEERLKEKRRLYAAFLAGAAVSTNPDYDRQIELLKDIETLRAVDIQVLSAFAGPPNDASNMMMGSRRGTLTKRLSGLVDADLSEVLKDLEARRLLQHVNNIGITVTGPAAVDLASLLTPRGRAVVGLLSSAV